MPEPTSSATAGRPAPIRLDDLADPRYTPDITEMLAAVEPMGAMVELNADALMTQASTELGLDDFGPSDFIPRLELLLRCLDTEALPLAEKNGFDLEEIVIMPANNLTVIFHRR